MGSRLRDAARRHWPIALLTLAAAFLILTNLGRTFLWEDEGDTAVLARSILHHGVPNAWDGVTFTEPDFGQRLTGSLTMVGHPWLQYYTAALSFALLGESSWAARLPFALAGVLAIVVVYAMLAVLARNRTAGLVAAGLVTLNVQYLLFARQARNYSLNALLTCLLIWQFHRLRSWKSAALFAFLAVLLFHAHPIGLAALAALGILTLAHPAFRDRRRWFWAAALPVAMYAAPWLLLARAGTRQNTAPLEHVVQLLPRLLQFAIEIASVTPAVGIVALYVYLFVRRRARAAQSRPGPARRSAIFDGGERTLAASCAAVIVAEAALMAVTHSRDGMWIVGLHHAPAIIPLATILAGLLLVKATGASRLALAALLIVFACTRFPQVTPWVAWSTPVAARDQHAVASFHVPVRVVDRFIRTTPVRYVRTLNRPNPGVIVRISEFLNANAAPGDVVLTNYAWESLYFYTGLPQAMKVARWFPIYSAARARGLPDYVFDTAGVRWIVWRRAWPAAFPEQDCGALLRRLAEAGITTVLAASIPESLYENRENVHFRRWADQQYVFPWYGPFPDVLIFRVDWESDVASLRERAEALLGRHELREAIVHFREYLKARPDDLVAWTRLGAALADAGNIGEAIPAFRQVANAAPEDAAAQKNMANALLEHGEAAQAESYARRAVALNAADAGSYDALGRALAAQGKAGEAMGQFELALKLDPANEFARDHLAQIRPSRARR